MQHLLHNDAGGRTSKRRKIISGVIVGGRGARSLEIAVAGSLGFAAFPATLGGLERTAEPAQK
jgi:hypothetical protein